MSGDARYALTVHVSGMLRLWDVATGICTRESKVEHIYPASVDFGPEGRFAFVGGYDGRAFLLDVSTGDYVRIFEGHTGEVNCVALSRDGRWAVSGSRDCTIKIWDVNTAACVGTLTGPTERVQRVALGATGRYLLSQDGRTCRLWELDWELEAVGQEHLTQPEGGSQADVDEDVVAMQRTTSAQSRPDSKGGNVLRRFRNWFRSSK